VALVVSAVGSLGAPLITSVATNLHVPLSSAQWTLTIVLLSGAVTTPVLGRLGAGPGRRTTILAVLATVLVGSVLTALPLPFAALLLGRALQGVGLALTALMMGTARDHLSGRRAVTAIAQVSVASTVGAGIGYPFAGLLDDVAGLHAAYGLGVVVAGLALVLAWRNLPAPPPRPPVRVDLAGAALLALGLLALLIVISQTTLLTHHLGVALGLLAVALCLGIGFVARERRSEAPVLDLALFRHPAIVAVNSTMFVAGIGMYLLLSLITRFVQTPSSVSYGFGVSTFVAGLVLVPFSLAGLLTGRLQPVLRRHVDAWVVLVGSALVVAAGCVTFAVARASLLECLVAMAMLGIGVGSFFASMPDVILALTPAAETSSAMAANQVVRTVGFSIGSAIAGMLLAAATTEAMSFPDDAGYSHGALLAGSLMVLSALSAALLLRRHTSTGAQAA
jgi:predicted MFS family arabinose efflux permease